MIKRLNEELSNKRRRLRLARIRKDFEKCGYSLDDLDDSRIEAALSAGGGGVEESPLTPKMIFFALRRLSSGAGEFPRKWTLK